MGVFARWLALEESLRGEIGEKEGGGETIGDNAGGSFAKKIVEASSTPVIG
jgi:hypothetical protein